MDNQNKKSAQGLASLGRGQDTELVHMTPSEVQGLQTLARGLGGGLTTNPNTGLPEAGFLSNVMPFLVGAALTPFMGPMAAGLAMGGGALAASGGDLKQAAKWGRRDENISYGTNPCSEIILRPTGQMCNLSEVVIRANDTKETLIEKVKLATILGTFQSTLTKFQFLSSDWTKNTEEERLLGVSLTGIMDNKMMSNPDPKFLEELRDVARKTNVKYAKLLDIPESASITCVKPSGTVSQLVDSASGIHARHNDYYIRTIRMDKKDSIYEFLKDKGVSVEDEAYHPDTTAVFSFPIKAPTNSIMRNDKTALEQLENWLIYQRHWCEHKPSVTISVKDDEWMEVGAWVWKHFDELSGISFLPHSDHSYKQAPYQDCSKEEYEALKKITPEVDFAELVEVDDNTTGAQTLACTGGSCEV